jgi:hypothetical protein
VITVDVLVQGDPPVEHDFDFARNTTPEIAFDWEPLGLPNDYTGQTALFVVYQQVEEAPLASITTSPGTYGQVTLGVLGTVTAGLYVVDLTSALTHALSLCGGCPMRYKAYVLGAGLQTCLAFGKLVATV